MSRTELKGFEVQIVSDIIFFNAVLAGGRGRIQWRITSYLQHFDYGKARDLGKFHSIYSKSKASVFVFTSVIRRTHVRKKNSQMASMYNEGGTI